MAATTNRAAARARLRQTLEAALDRLIPLDENVPLKGRRFLDFEQQADELKRALLPTFLEERAALDSQAQVAAPGRWPIGSGPTEAAVKQFNKRIKGTEQFWNPQGAEAIMALRALWRSEDGRWDRYWLSRPAHSNAA